MKILDINKNKVVLKCGELIEKLCGTQPSYMYAGSDGCAHMIIQCEFYKNLHHYIFDPEKIQSESEKEYSDDLNETQVIPALASFIKEYGVIKCAIMEGRRVIVALDFYKIAALFYKDANPNWSFNEYVEECLKDKDNYHMLASYDGHSQLPMISQYVRSNYIEKIDIPGIMKWCTSQKYGKRISDLIVHMYAKLPQSYREKMLYTPIHANHVGLVVYMILKNDANLTHLISDMGTPSLSGYINDREYEFYKQLLLFRSTTDEIIRAFYDMLPEQAKSDFKEVYTSNSFDAMYKVDLRSEVKNEICLSDETNRNQEIAKRLHAIQNKLNDLEAMQQDIQTMIDNLTEYINR